MRLVHCALVVFVGLACAPGDDTVVPTDEEHPDHTDDAGAASQGVSEEFQRLLRYTRVYPVERSLKQIVMESIVIGIGQFGDVARGRTIDYKTGASNPILTAVFRLDLKETLRGMPVQRLFVEWPQAIVTSPAELKEHMPRGSFVFVVQMPTWDQEVYKFENAGSGHPPDETLFAFSYPFGIIAEGQSSLEYTLLHAANELPAEVFQSKTIDELRGEIASIQASLSDGNN